MNAASHLFLLCFLPAAVVGWRAWNRLGNCAARIWLLAAGLIFCGWAAPPSLLVLGAEGTVSFLLGRAMGRQGARKKLLLGLGAGLILAVLFLFKYASFFLAPWTTGLPGFLAPLGLSFASFQQLFWLRDRYAGDAPDVSPLDFACCLTFFATATCGPITRVGEMAPQLRRPAPFSWEDMSQGLCCFALGLAKKVLLAGLFAGGADWGFSQAGSLNAPDAILTSLCYTLQIYFDFSGYCDMAWGMGRMMGVDLPVNFDSPYQAASIQDFWDRWHITLSRFFRHCVYIPLGGNRRGMAVTCRNIMIIYLLSGLWHGAGWGFLIWGALHGTAMVVQRVTRDRFTLPKPLGWLLTFLFVNFAWVFFRSESLTQAVALLRDMAVGGWGEPSAQLAAALALPEFTAATKLVNLVNWDAAEALRRLAPLLAIPAGMLLLVCKNPVRRAEKLAPSVPRALFTAVLLFWSAVSLVGVDTFIYANF